MIDPDLTDAPPPKADAAESMSYISQSRGPGMSVLIILPLLAAYQIGIVHGEGNYRNLAGVWVMNVLASAFGAPGPMLVNTPTFGCAMSARLLM